MKEQKQISHNELKGSITVEDVLGKDVIDTEGDNIGVTSNVYLNPKDFDVLGVAVDTGFLDKGMIIGSAYVREVTKHAVFLNTKPVYKLLGMMVYDKEGGKIGRVKKVVLKERKNEIALLHVKMPFFRKATIPISKVEKIQDSVMLNITKAEMKEI
ncbi:MAG: PRC-barrel domain-containing protein [Candidatus Woesearchaeota archaeon]|nr:PRC-barrel domain-containing protein [Candidatus Woesearchaeota archaeon]